MTNLVYFDSLLLYASMLSDFYLAVAHRRCALLCTGFEGNIPMLADFRKSKYEMRCVLCSSRVQL